MRAGTVEPRIPELDGLRGTAVGSVLLYHLFYYSMAGKHWSGAAAFVSALTEYMWQGVDLFFVLSGFLITGILLDTRADPSYFRNFYARRALRILPVYYMVLAVIVAVYPHSGSYGILLLLFMANMGPVFHVPMFNGALWSLSVEEHFYLVWPLIVRRLSLKGVAKTALAVILLEPVVRAVSFGHVASANIYIYSWFRLDGLACGALVACIIRSSFYSRRAASWLSGSLLIAGLIVRTAGTPWGILTHDTRFGAMLQFVPGDMIFSAAVLWAVSHSGERQTAILRNRFLRLAADLSYCIYVIHMMVMGGYDYVAHRIPGLPAPGSTFSSLVLKAVIVTAACFLFAAASRKFVELPALRLKRFFAAGRPSAARGEEFRPGLGVSKAHAGV